MKYCYLILLSVLLAYSCTSPSKESTETDSTFTATIDSVGLKDNLQEEQPVSEEEGVNVDSIIKTNLTAQLEKKSGFSAAYLDSLRKTNDIESAHSVDGQLWYFGWPMDGHGTFISYVGLFCFKNTKGKYVVVDDEGEVPYEKIYKLSHPSKDLYLCYGNTRACATCEVDAAVVIEIQQDSLSENYPAFEEKREKGITNVSYYSVVARMGNISEFDYDPATQILKCTYVIDDMNSAPAGIVADMDQTISGTLEWKNGKFEASYKVIPSENEGE